MNLAAFLLVYSERLAGVGVENTSLARYQILNVLYI